MQPFLGRSDALLAMFSPAAVLHGLSHCLCVCVCSIEYNVSYVYHALYAYFDRDNVALPGLASFFKAASEEEREHAELLMAYQNTRGGRVRLASIIQPETEFNHAEKVQRGGGGTAGEGKSAGSRSPVCMLAPAVP